VCRQQIEKEAHKLSPGERFEMLEGACHQDEKMAETIDLSKEGPT
jgi:hypothetical protein